jgi:hypothetical protein
LGFLKLEADYEPTIRQFQIVQNGHNQPPYISGFGTTWLEKFGFLNFKTGIFGSFPNFLCKDYEV